MASDAGEANTDSPASRADIVGEGLRMVQLATGAGLHLRLLGGVAVRQRCPSAANPPFARTYGDLDFAAPRRSGRAVIQLFEASGYTADRRFNAFHGDKRLLFYDDTDGRKIDIFLGAFQMCHTLELESRLALSAVTLPLADLLLTKMQIVKLNAKDALDVMALLTDHAIVRDGGADAGESIDGGYIANLCGNDWGWYTTLVDNVEKVTQLAPDLIGDPHMTLVTDRLTQLQELVVTSSKSMKWKMRAAVGRHVPWYEEPEEV